MASESSPLVPAAKTAPSQRCRSPTTGPSPRRADHAPILRDIIIGFSDGLTVPFALTAGLSSLGSARLVVMGGLAELFSGMISMGLGAYLAAATEQATQEALQSEGEGEGGDDENAAVWDARVRRSEIRRIVDAYDLQGDCAAALVEELCAEDSRAGRRGEAPPRRLRRAWVSGATMGASYLVGGLIPMLPYFATASAARALVVSVVVTLVVLLVFGYAKDFVAVRSHAAGVRGAAQTLVVGVVAAGTSYAIVRWLDRGGL